MKTWIEVNKKALKSNLGQFRKLVGNKVRIMGVVKSHAYGHGLIETSQAITTSVDWLGVDSLTEGATLKKAGIKNPILILGYVELSDLKEALRNDLTLTVYNNETINYLGKITKANPQLKPRVHIKIETGTKRQGVEEGDIVSFLRLIKKYPKIEVEGISTHYANIEDTTDSSFAEKQLRIFKKVSLIVEKNTNNKLLKHTACSAAAILYPETYFDMVRTGISMYGLWSSKETKAVAKNKKIKIDLKPALNWKTKVAQIKKIKKGTAISYGLTESVSKDSIIAIIPVGYFDGFDRKLSSVGNVLIKGQRCKILGRVCMNMFVVDITNVKAKVEDEVVLLGKQGKEEITADEIAQKIGTINYEVVARINPSLPRIVK